MSGADATPSSPQSSRRALCWPRRRVRPQAYHYLRSSPFGTASCGSTAGFLSSRGRPLLGPEGCSAARPRCP
eukprot:scaffold1108_cov387-Prasinococcus_capsulatus_cf.AAC.12